MAATVAPFGKRRTVWTLGPPMRSPNMAGLKPPVSAPPAGGACAKASVLGGWAASGTGGCAPSPSPLGTGVTGAVNGGGVGQLCGGVGEAGCHVDVGAGD